MPIYIGCYIYINLGVSDVANTCKNGWNFIHTTQGIQIGIKVTLTQKDFDLTKFD